MRRKLPAATRPGGQMWRAPLAAVLAAALLLAGCGIPDETDVVPLRPGPSTGISSGDDPSPAHATRADTSDPAGFAKNYLEAAAGDLAGAGERVKQFLSPDAAAAFKIPAEITVVRLTEEPLVNPGKPVVIKTRLVGTLGSKGILVPATDDQTASYELDLGQIEGQQGLFVSDAPKVLLLSDTALNRFYTKRTIYFWNQDHSGLVPDVRYLPLEVPSVQQPTTIIDWLISGPSDWLAGVVDPLRDGTKQIGNVPAISNETLQINLSGALDPEDPTTSLDRLQKQLRWSLRTNLPTTLHLNVEHQVEKDYTGTDYLTSNAAYRATAEPERFVVYNQQIRRLSRSFNSGQPVPILKPEDNRAVRMAAMSTSGNQSYVALVVNESRGRQVLKVGTATAGNPANLRRVPLPGPAGRPVWGKSLGDPADTTGLITAGGKLYSFAADGKKFGAVAWPGGPGQITAVAAAPDARRIALLARGRLYVAALSSGDSPQLSSPYEVHTELRDLSAVDWSSEGLLVVAGVRPASQRVAILDVSIDGATQTERMPDLGSNPVTYLTAVPANPTRGEEIAGAIAYVLDNSAYDEVNQDEIEVGDLAEAVTNPPKDVRPVAPFFLN